ncbi:OmcA/MtrC family decaheme c-type cytochrome [Shewanella pealeana]|uniref:Decaheme cytochrome c n=1 Tax=Shewanella pealeana (strain ATCC 700345 / ANG-SQ1) TaxID=398579 RepID=A8H631_SHEPA|nr:OmcA/MtrC family decaheme c-type cytochrome [Shewanella pealeana]ABV88018.1 decaheme cytochrome c [Shewanella pealeana ATCC 700345]
MMNTNKSKIALLLAAGAVSMALTGCGGDDGNDGNSGNPGGPAADYINTLNLKVTDVTYTDGVPTINVFATNEEDLPVVGLTALEVKKVVQLIPQGATGAGNSAEWQATYSSPRNDAEKLKPVDLKNGNYSFTIPVEGYNSELTQRYNVIASASTLADGETSVPRTELSQDFSGEGYEATYTKDVVATASCTSCHAEGKKIYHGYTSSETCAACHTQEMADEKGKPHVAYNFLIHNVHNNIEEAHLPDDEKQNESAEKAYALIQDNCTTCHIAPTEDSNELTEWGNWSSVPTMETCTSCHTGIDFVAGKGHSQQADNSNCIACHSASWTEELHNEGFAQKKAFIEQYGMVASLTAVKTDTGSDTTLSVTITDAAGSAIDATAIVDKIEQLETITNVGPNYPIMGYKPNPINGTEKVVINLTEADIVDGKFVTVIKDLPYGDAKTDTDTAFTLIGLSLCNDGETAVKCEEGVSHTSVKAAMAHGTLSGEAPSVRHTDSVNFKACESCHGTEWELHEKYHAGFVMTEQLGRENADGETVVGVDACATCHTPDGVGYSGNSLALEMRLHKTHKQGDYAVIAGMNCDQCHSDFNRDAFKNKGAIETSSGAYSTPIAATCVSCHSYNLDSFKAHAEGQGAIVNNSEMTKQQISDAAQLETCFYCHKPTADDHTSVKM